MDPKPNLLELYNQAAAARAGGGYHPDEIDAIIAKATNGAVPSYFELSRHADRLAETQLAAMESTLSLEDQLLSDSGARGETGLGDMASLLLDDLSLGFADELIGTVAPRAGAAQKDRVNRVRATAPMSAQMLTGAAAAVLPGSIAANLMRGGGIIRAGIQGAGLGAAANTAHHVGSGDGSVSERAEGGLVPAAIGTVTGFFGGVTGRVGQHGVAAATGSPNARVARQIARQGGDAAPPVGLFGKARSKLSGSPRQKTISTSAAVDQQLQTSLEDVGRMVFSPMDNAPVAPAMRDFVENVRGTEFGNAMPRSGRVDFNQLRAAHSKLKGVARSASGREALDAEALATRMGEEMEMAFPGYLEARRAFRMSAEEVEAYRIAYNRQTGSGETHLTGLAQSGWGTEGGVTSALQQFDAMSPKAGEAARMGMRQRLMDDLLKTKTGTVPHLQMLADAESGGRQMMREMFVPGREGDRAFTQFLRTVQDEHAFGSAGRTFRQLTRAGLTTAAFGAGAGTVSFFR